MLRRLNKQCYGEARKMNWGKVLNLAVFNSIHSTPSQPVWTRCRWQTTMATAPTAAEKIKEDYFPYGDSSFEGIRNNSAFWCDNSRYIFDLVEDNAKHQMFLRPPRWGKSLFMDMLHCYLDINRAKEKFDNLFAGTDIYERKKELKHCNQYFVMKFDFSVQVRSGADVAAIKKEFDQEIENSVEMFCDNYNLSWNEMKTPFVLGTMERVINKVVATKGARVFLLIDEYDRFANELMFNDPVGYDKVVAGASCDKFSSPVRSFFGAVKSFKSVRSFTVGLSPVALTDGIGSDANNILFITQSPRFANMLGFAKADVERALKLLFKDEDLTTAVDVAMKFFNGYRFPCDLTEAPGEPLYTPQLCLRFFRKCFSESFRTRVLDGSVSLNHMTDPNVKVSNNIVTLLAHHPELPVIFASLATPEGVKNAAVQETFNLSELRTSPGPDLPVSFMVWHGLLTRGENGEFRIPNQVMGDPNELLKRLLSEIYRGAERKDTDALALVQKPTADRLWKLLTASLQHIGSTFDNTVSELAIRGLVEQFLRTVCGNSVHIEVEESTLKNKRFDMCLTALATGEKLLIEFKRLRPGRGANPGDLSHDLNILKPSTHAEARNLVEKREITPRKQHYHGNAKTVGELEASAMRQCQAYKAAMRESTKATIRCATAIHATVVGRSGTDTKYTGSTFLVSVETR